MEGDLAFRGTNQIVGDGTAWGVTTDRGGSIESAPDARLEIEDVAGALYAAHGTLTLHGLHARNVVGDAVVADVPVSGSGWLLEDVGGYALDGSGADVALADVVARRTGGLHVEGARLALEGLRVEDPNATEAIVAVRRGVLDARGLALSGVPGIGILLEDAGGRLTDVGMSGAARAVVQRSCSGAAPALEVTGLTCDGCASAAVERCEDGP